MPEGVWRPHDSACYEESATLAVTPNFFIVAAPKCGARLIAMFRNPVDMVHSLHSHLLYVAQETEADFEKAWRLQERRSQGFDLPRRSRGAFLVQYAEEGRLGTRLQRAAGAEASLR